MARPKDTELSLAFRERSDQEWDKLESKLAKDLKQDMARLLDEGIHADITLILPGPIDIPIHSAIVKHRAPAFYAEHIEPSTQKAILLETNDVHGLKAFLSSVYTDDNVPISAWNSSVRDEGATSEEGENNGNSEAGDEDAANSNKVAGCELLSGCCPLANCLLAMYQQRIGADVIFLAQGKPVYAHRSIISARSCFFSAMLNGDWRESSVQEINLGKVSAVVLEQVFHIIYGAGAYLLPSCDLGELVVTGDMYAITGVKHIATFLFKRDFCHFFHKPCGGCLMGVCETLPYAISYGLVDLSDRCLRWASKYFLRLWPTKQFALLPSDIREICYNHVIKDINASTVLDIVMEADRISEAIPPVRWAEPITAMTKQVIDACIVYISLNLVDIMATQKFLSMATTMALGLDLLHGVMQRAIGVVPVELACQTYLKCQCLEQTTKDENCSWNEDFCKLVHAIYEQCKQILHQRVHQLMGTAGWKLLSSTEQMHIKEGGSFMVPDEAKKPPYKGNKGRSNGASLATRPNMIPSHHHRGQEGPPRSIKPPNSSDGSSTSSGGCSPRSQSHRKNGLPPKFPSGTKPTKSTTHAHDTTSRRQKAKASSQVETSTMKKPSQRSSPPKSGGADNISRRIHQKGAVSGTPETSTVKEHLEHDDNDDDDYSDDSPIKSIWRQTEESASNTIEPSCCSNAAKDAALGHVDASAAKYCGFGKDISVRKLEASDTNAPAQLQFVGPCQSLGKTDKHNASVNQHKSHKSNMDSKLTNGADFQFKKPGPKQPTLKSASHSLIARPKSGSKKSNKDMLTKQSSKKSHTESIHGALGHHSQTKDAKTAPNQYKAHNKHHKMASNQKRDLMSQECSEIREGSSKLLKPKSRPHKSSTTKATTGFSKPSSRCSQIPSPRSGRSTSSLANNSAILRDASDMTSNNNRDVFDKCTSMRIAAMKSKKMFDTDFETESVISTLSHMAVKGSRAPSIVDFDLSPNDLSPEELCIIGRLREECFEKSDDDDVRQAPDVVQLPNPEEHVDIIFPTFNTIFILPSTRGNNR